jgi:hypothetical protein
VGVPAAVPGTDLASGVSPGASADEVFYTIGGDTRVFHRVLSSGEVSVAHDFGAAGIARDVHVVGRRLVAVVGGHVAFGVDPVLGPTQISPPATSPSRSSPTAFPGWSGLASSCCSETRPPPSPA